MLIKIKIPTLVDQIGVPANIKECGENIKRPIIG